MEFRGFGTRIHIKWYTGAPMTSDGILNIKNKSSIALLYFRKMKTNIEKGSI